VAKSEFAFDVFDCLGAYFAVSRYAPAAAFSFFFQRFASLLASIYFPGYLVETYTTGWAATLLSIYTCFAKKICFL
jgi:hypothetical protein